MNKLLSSNRETLRRLLREQAPATGIDSHAVSRCGQGFVLIGILGTGEMIFQGWDEQAKAVGGLETAADPVASAIMAYRIRHGFPLNTFMVRKAPHDGKLVEGQIKPGDHVVIVDGVLITGDSVLRAIRAVKELGAKVLGVLVVVDREEGGREKLEDLGYTVVSLYTASEILAE
ncbi:MAG: hypothetical protein A2754_03650 [Candidatus Magasanikbacteria bacterium RIFCSPHIGHO2_01_FULL_47_8]|uniref:Orotate phosphoribosyltransferase n=1 Tax=Candidatus Magasanikbacteria bacterium RIFCSPHIGHO2_01_FULL_47_8 TaxID=1798673 RepID=A0A1F6MG35_9BACT|nr:MAG: hypothetical protein A2754_03650 [Candidatus Magasanikbacteria bacterium RIFCSPHIGHO2_01_FULL_47_8]